MPENNSAGDPFKPSPNLLIALGSMIVHADEFMSDDGHELDRHTFQSQINQPEVQAWLAEMDKQALLPRKRKS